jgi:hypothetical protein
VPKNFCFFTLIGFLILVDGQHLGANACQLTSLNHELKKKECYETGQCFDLFLTAGMAGFLAKDFSRWNHVLTKEQIEIIKKSLDELSKKLKKT